MAQSWLITGGSSGIGLSIGRAVLQKGGTAVLTTRNVEKAQKSAPDVAEKGGHWLQLDLVGPSLEATVKDAIKRYNVDVIINNAGFPLVGAVEECSPDAIREQYEANVFGPVRIIQAATPIFRQRKAGTIVNVGSVVSYSGMPANSIYGSTKAALRTITEGLTGELATFGIRVLLIELGRFRTNFGSGVELGHGGKGHSDAYNGTAVEQILGFLRNAPPASGDPDLAALRIYEIVTKTGLAAGDKVKDWPRFPLGVDSQGYVEKAANDWSQLATTTKEIATSTDFKE